MARIVCIGEAMLELRRKGSGWELGHGGDTLNTAVHLSRAGHDVAYLTALGDDPFSDDLKARWAAEGLDTSLVLTHPARQPGLYAISTDRTGERSFTYWRDTSAAREMFALPESEAAALTASHADLVYFSLISLAILPAEGRDRLLALARAAPWVAFDGNYRPQLWASAEEARTMRDAAVAVAEIGLPTLDDELLLQASPVRGPSPAQSGTEGTLDAKLRRPFAAGEDEVAAHWQDLGCAETVVKLGGKGCRLPDGTIVAPECALQPVDTSGAGDAFNAGYLDARLNGAGVEQAARAGHTLAGWTIMRPGAIPARSPSDDS